MPGEKRIMTRTRLDSLYLLLFGSVVFTVLGLAMENLSQTPMLDFAVVYNPARCLLQHRDPYNESEVLRIYQAGKENGPFIDPNQHPVTRRFIYLPTAFAITLPFALLSWGPAHILWMTLTITSIIFASFLIWECAADSAPIVCGLLLAFLLANSEMMLVLCNSAGISISLCIVAVWCFLRGRFAAAGILCLAFSLALKPHDSGLVWLYFLLAGGVYRKRALQTFLAAALICLPFVLWVGHIAPHWVREWRANLLSFSAPGGINDPSLDALRAHGRAGVINLQSALSIFWDNPRFYNPVAWLLCGALLLVWLLLTLRARCSPLKSWLALAFIAAITMLTTGHHYYDAKLLLLTVPACAMLWAEGGPIRWIAFLVTAAGMVFTGDFPLAILASIANNIHFSTTGFMGKMLTLALLRPAPLALLAVAIFYLWIYARHACKDSDASLSPQSKDPMPGGQASAA
jgi:hypothetical protein